MATTFLTERLMRAADALLQHGECIEVRYVGLGQWRTVRLLGRGPEANTVRLGIWCEGGEIREGRHPIRFIDCLLLPETERRLAAVAREQDPRPELERAIEFATRARRQRRRNGQFADCTHRAEPRGVR